MANEQSQSPAKAAWPKVFSGFKIALDMKKMLLAAAGILVLWLGWWALSWTFYGMRNSPNWEKDYDKAEEKEENRQILWNHFKAKRASWNLIHELAGPTSLDPRDSPREDAADVTDNFQEFLVLAELERVYKLTNEAVVVKEKTLEIPGHGPNSKFTLTFDGDEKDADAAFTRVRDKKWTLQMLLISERKEGKDDAKVIVNLLRLGQDQFKAEGPITDLKKKIEEIKPLHEVAVKKAATPKLAEKALETFRTRLMNPKIKPSGRLRVSPWHEFRGQNPYLVVANGVKTRGESVLGGGKVFSWLLGEESPVLLEPLYKFLTPIVYFFDSRAGGWDRVYLLALAFWMLAVWGFFGGAICRIAAVQIARNERIGLREALIFTRERFLSYLAAPAIALGAVAVLILVLIIFGWLEWVPYVGDVFAGVFWPIPLIFGLIMAAILVGLVGWPLMTATISTEGTDSFDALSRSYSYVYQAPWQYLWYTFLAIVYGAAVVFFIGLMASMMVFLGKWGVSCAPGLAKADPKSDREPSYLFQYAPTSFGWRDLLISSSAHVETRKELLADGRVVDSLRFKDEYEKAITGMNRFGAVVVSLWIYPLFLLLIGFGYSYFWSASTLIYFLMRHYVDDTGMDDVHQDDEEFEDPFLKPAAAPPPAPATKPGVVSLNVVEGPPPAPPPPPATVPFPGAASQPPLASPTPTPEPPATPDGPPPTDNHGG